MNAEKDENNTKCLFIFFKVIFGITRIRNVSTSFYIVKKITHLIQEPN